MSQALRLGVGIQGEATLDVETETAGYLEVLRRFHGFLRPKTYFEIGTLSGRSLELAQCPSIAVDLRFAIEADVFVGKPSCFFFQMSSDEFFARYRPSELFGCPIDMAFLDGMHLLEFILRDFIQVEKHSRRNSLIIMHDCIPADANMTSRIHELGTAWTGDVWKILLVLAKYRPDLKIQVLQLTADWSSNLHQS